MTTLTLRTKAFQFVLLIATGNFGSKLNSLNHINLKNFIKSLKTEIKIQTKRSISEQKMLHLLH